VVAEAPSSQAWLTLAENLSQACSLGPWTYTVANGLNVEKFAKNALSYNRRNAAAQYLIAARWVFAPSPFSNHKKGIEMMQAIFNDGDMEKDDHFNVYSAIGYAYIQQKKYGEARPWLQKALEIYPTNKYIAEQLAKK
jgi:tetratricopeptide (TPR) repeat protein